MIKRLAILALLLCSLAACGNKGPLLLPEHKPAAAPPASADAPPATPQPSAPSTQP
jgi:predicted small lipoprotein YifL